MIRRSLIVGTLAVLAWHLIMPRLPRTFYAVPGQQRGNYLNAQKFVHEAPPGASVIVGSSMANRFDPVALGPDHVKLTFPGEGPLIGLELIRGAGKTPPVVWIETNVMLREADAAMLDDVLSPWRIKLRDASPVFKEKGRPSEFGVGFVKAVVSKACKFAEGRNHTPPAKDNAALEGQMLEDIMKGNRAHLDKRPDPAVLKKRIHDMGQIVDELTKRGSRCVFFEMPFDASLTQLAEPVAIRKAMKERFPEDRYLWLELKRDTPFETTDGVHLKPHEALWVVDRMKEFEKSLK